ncbi:protein kinase [Sporosarcina sp. P1]|uniref:protein kinase domain-containing protein n=1 Tax=Sporosarcina sp. P1 TaxID=2048257 RepID=UPI000C1661BF|nr:protein kinase [Sporosarcina sp. P1]PIC83026.1 hypothetical protein CSV73_09890 [Sporosarcina sp. P1]
MSKEDVDINLLTRLRRFVKQNKKSVILSLGEVSNLKEIGQGGNGLVYGGVQNNHEVAIKFLVEDNSERKIKRFKAEYFNIVLLEDRNNIVNYINYEELFLEGGYLVPAIIMKRYDKSLKKMRSDTPEINEETFIKLFYFLLNTLHKIHQNGIIHRDIKPENILVTKEIDFVLTDFGIANYNPELYTLKAETVVGERLANYEFSAPEQAIKGVVPAHSMDIYALAQVCQWYVFGTTHRGTNRRRITDAFKSEEVEVIEIVLNKCLYNDHEQRYQNIDDVYKHITEIKELRRKVDPFEEMNILNDVISATCPSVSEGLQFVEDEKYIKRLVENINNRKFRCKLEYNTGMGDSSFSNLTYLGNRTVLLDYREVKIKGIWLYTNSGYDDLILIEIDENEPFVINGNETYYALIINDEHIVGPHCLNSGYVEIEDQVYSLKDVKVDEYYRVNEYKYISIGTNFHSSIIPANDSLLNDLQDKRIIKKDVHNLIRNLRRNKHREVGYRL